MNTPIESIPGIEIVPFSDAALASREKTHLIDGLIYELTQNRRIEVWKIEREPGLCIRIYRRTQDAKVSKLMFGLSPEAALALADGLLRQVKKQTNPQPSTPQPSTKQ